jgi:mono/diheme cytochrome c family protein
MRLSHVLPFVATAASAFVAYAALTPRTGDARTADPTFAEDVAPILYRNCTSCHHPGGLGPFSLLDYDSAAPKLAKIKGMVASRRMPPWQADGPRGVFRNDRRLTDEERNTIVRWVDAGAKPGDMAKLPPRPTYDAKWEIGTPDLVVQMPNDYVVPATGTIEYQYFEASTGLTEEKWVKSIEVMPGSRKVVHHVLVFAKVPPPPGATPPARRDGPPPTPLLIRNRAHALPETPGTPTRQLGALIGTTAPGTNVVEFPEGTALRLRAGTVLTFQMHYTAHGHETTDRTSVGFKFAPEMPNEEIFATSFQNGSLLLPAGAKDVAVPAEIAVSQPVKIWGLFPHTHLRGKRWEYRLEKPDGTSELVLDVPRYDFNWQTYYLFNTPLEIPVGGKLTSMAWYDNSATNKHNPDPSIDVKWGDQTWEEMQYTGFLYTVPSRRLRPAP